MIKQANDVQNGGRRGAQGGAAAGVRRGENGEMENEMSGKKSDVSECMRKGDMSV